MKLFETSILIFFILWLLVAAWVALSGHGRFQRIRKFLRFNGWFNQWTMFMPNRDGKVERFTVSYRDQSGDGNIGEWHEIQLERSWKPTLFMINPDIRVYGFMLQAVRSFAYLNRVGKQPKDAALYNFFNSVVLDCGSNKQAEKRQIKVEQSTHESTIVLVQSDFLILS